MGILLVISYKELGRDSDPNEDGTEGPDMILRMFKASCVYIAREVAAGFTVVLNPSHTLILGSDSAFTRPKPVLWISKEAQRTSKLSPGRGVRVDPPRGPHKGINKHAVDKIAGLGDIELVAKFITTFFGKASEYICSAALKKQSVDIDFHPVGRLTIDSTTASLAFEAIEHDYANVALQETSDPLVEK
ncbi:hypothetical protein Pmar_PMAR008112 [Perkinsus marinus ATCC 50983]|uniref:Uncharacterized protein n=1 Tax=Perkinsus marinus (strain ATCC 50983 / TXsc) TaxID=423536 RepID=C5KDB7_PERM5|nr:hypothetical protein Pmar_PMAR008112 [Perkinsus marinus ATCC 50983]EER17550.1 hypothetical protein Pmar_PMAR008112 [Perkinsus marinus ATCC 50983]|eukprot:XP_002785754.1 hypothetical protein Pmar_PMAR008112 [Perkinsus marinus ATCC 50983]